MTGKVHRFAAQILQQERHAAKGALGQAIGNGLARNTFLHLHNRVDRGVSGSDGSKRCVQEFTRADLATGHAAFEADLGSGRTQLNAAVSLLPPENALSEAMFF